ncbi:MAG: undecaprenyldiphospho-muramoylpentapeptide beta-N-acetylglucosaminyltransferase [Clostridiales bacterium]|nr:undecaprenyldiphospho-muramoylpentapeptide beta-N-acetylglucosaminyltransferase [Clostridiales bacterium]MCD7827204.1 undecaprenyldiphospho-muramoylpentapeptide beta-N-acetylglucosaminyltransferase [Clostridiales bacterium]
MRIVFAAGGTGGHVNPAIAAAGEIRDRYPDSEILFIGTKDKIEANLVPKAGFEFKTISISGFHRKLTIKNIGRNITTLCRFIQSSAAVKGILKEFKPDAVIGFGGYVSGPVVRTAARMGIKTAIHEQNAFPGVANKMLAKHVDAVMLNLPEAKDRLQCKNEPIVTGIPVRNEILRIDRDFAKAELGLDDKPLILSFGGSLGANGINTAMVNLIAELHNTGKCNFIHGYGQSKWVPDTLLEKGVDIENEKGVDVREYIYDMDKCLAASDIIICRSGASTLAEIETVGRASILIPSPNVTENHQYYNAMALVNNNAARVIEEKDLTDERLLALVNELLDDDAQREEIGRNANKMSVTDAQDRICDVIISLV